MRMVRPIKQRLISAFAVPFFQLFFLRILFMRTGLALPRRIKDLSAKVAPEKVAALAIEARSNFKLRHVPLFLVRQLAKDPKARHLVADTLATVIQRPDELSEFVSLYWAEKKEPLAASVKKGLAAAFTKFNEYSLSKYNQNNKIKLRDVLFLCHAKPVDKEQERVWKKLIDNKLEIADTWEARLSEDKGQNKKAVWESLLKEDKLGALALIRNLRNFKENNVDEDLIISALEKMNAERVLPFRFISAAKYYPAFEPYLEKAMFKCLDGAESLKVEPLLLLM